MPPKFVLLLFSSAWTFTVTDMKGQKLKKISHSPENPINTRLYQMLRKLHWIKELDSAALEGGNYQIRSFGTLVALHVSILSLIFLRNNADVLEAMDSNSITKNVNLTDSIDQPQDVHKIKTMPFSCFLPKRVMSYTDCSDLSVVISWVPVPTHILLRLIS